MPNGFVSFAEVKRAVSMEAVLSRYEVLAGLSPKGANLVGACPFCKTGSARQFQVSLAKNAWYCFGCKQGGNVLDFVAKKENLSLFAAALALDERFELGLAGGAPRADPPSLGAAPPAAHAETLPAENPPLTFTLKTLDPLHLSLAGLELQPSTIERFGAGYCTKGLLKGRLAIPVYNRGGELVAYAGLAVGEDDSPRYLFPPKFQPQLEVFNLQRLEEFAEQDGPLHLAPYCGSSMPAWHRCSVSSTVRSLRHKKRRSRGRPRSTSGSSSWARASPIARSPASRGTRPWPGSRLYRSTRSFRASL